MQLWISGLCRQPPPDELTEVFCLYIYIYIFIVTCMDGLKTPPILYFHKAGSVQYD